MKMTNLYIKDHKIMATKKAVKKTAAPEKATANKKPGKALARWDEELARRAAIARGTVDSVGGGAKQISLKAGMLTIDGAAVPGNKINVVVLDSVIEHTLREGAYQEDGDNTPICFAIGRDARELAPHELSTEPQHDDCRSCPWNKFGSAETGRGKACKERNRLILIAETDLEDIPSADVRVIALPVTSGKAWVGYVKQIDETFNIPPIGVVTEISVVPDQKTQFRVQFKLVEQLSEEYFEDLFAKADASEEDLMRAYEKRDDEGEDEGTVQRFNRGGGKGGKSKGGSGRRVQEAPQRRTGPVVPAKRGKPAPVERAVRQRPQAEPVKPKGKTAPAKTAPAKAAPAKGKRKF